ncbi:hypothetical protein VTN31DRAFT_6923 [Thermomyces dupontii]|uniref:uncharacterized protein n=1 Tax=Talaromyces thermophilus TaxID=28565 RepID=UPI0037442BB7
MAVSPPPTGRQSKMPRGDTPTAKMSAGNRSGPPSAAPGMQFPRGEVRKTWAFGCPREADIKIEEVLQRGDLELAILSSFQWDMEWLFSKLNTRSSRFLLVMQAKDDATKRQYERETADMPNLRLCFPPMDGQVNCMHSKLMLLFHPTYLRIVVPSANLVPYDWGESGGIMENIVFLIDLPKRTSDSFKPTPFYEDLVYFLRASTLHENIIAKISTFDFSETTRYAFVHTIGGSHTNDTCHRTGHQGLARAVSRMGLATEQEIQVDYVTSSVGSLNEDFLRHLYRSVQGQPSEPKPTSTGVSGFMNNFRAYYPSQQTVHRSKGGPMNAGTICFQEKWFLGPRFPKSVMRDCVSRREGILMHNKILFARFRKPIPFRPMSVKKDAEEGQENETCTAWAYVGSANLSESAWGKLVQDRVTKKPKLNCRNWECGVIVPVTSSAPSAPTTEQGDVDREADFASVFDGTIPVPMKVPGERYREDGGLRPWYGMMF